MSEETQNIPELTEIVGALLFGAKGPISAKQIRNTMAQSAITFGGITEEFAEVKEKAIKEAIEQLSKKLEEQPLGLSIAEVAGGYRLQNDLNCGPWLRQLLDKGKPAKLSRPALETLSIIAYRQPATRGEIEKVRGVSVDSMVKSLMELQLVKVVGRSELPGRPWLFGTTQTFLEHFGLKELNALPGMDELKRHEEAMARHSIKEGEELDLEGEEEEPKEDEGAEENTVEEEFPLPDGNTDVALAEGAAGAEEAEGAEGAELVDEEDADDEPTDDEPSEEEDESDDEDEDEFDDDDDDEDEE